MVREKFINTNDPGPAPIVYSSLRNYFPPGTPHLNFCLTSKPVGNRQRNPGYTWWKYGHHPYHDQMYRSCTPYGCSTAELNGETAQGQSEAENLAPVQNMGRVPQEYYEDSEQFCAGHPDHELCPNHWI